jgi:hypothetical protein
VVEVFCKGCTFVQEKMNKPGQEEEWEEERDAGRLHEGEDQAFLTTDCTVNRHTICFFGGRAPMD